MGFDCIHSAVDDHSRLAYSEIHHDEKADTCAGFLRRAALVRMNHPKALATQNRTGVALRRGYAL